MPETLSSSFKAFQITPTSTLYLNGFGTFSFENKSLCDVAIYTKKLTSSGIKLLDCDGPKRINFVARRSIEVASFGNFILKSMKSNMTSKQIKDNSNNFSQFEDVFFKKDAIHMCEKFSFEYNELVGFNVVLEGVPSKPLAKDKFFFESLLSIWVGDQPVDFGLKNKLLNLAS